MSVHLNAFNQKLIDIKYIINGKENNVFSDKLSQIIWDFYLKNTQNYRLFDKKIRLKNKLSQILPKYLNCRLGLQFVGIFFSGSTANGFATIDSDIDLCLIVNDSLNYVHRLDFNKTKKVNILSEIEFILEHNRCHPIDCQVIRARVPILRYIDSCYRFRVEINANNECGIRNTRLLYCYSKLDWRVVPICIAIKRWAKHYRIIDSLSGALSSYCIELMVIFYLQTCRPPILPSLQLTSPAVFDPEEAIESYEELPDLDQLFPFESLNNESLSQLFVGFFRYYVCDFDFTQDVASVRLAQIVRKHGFEPFLKDPNQWEYICVEEPFSESNCGRTLYDRAAYHTLINQFKLMHNKSIEIIDLFCDCI